jgi:hypothetical protein
VPPAAHPNWRWETYQGVQVQVPPDWEYGVPYGDWCVGTWYRENRVGAVGRPGATFAIACKSEYPPVNQRENELTFNSSHLVGERGFGGGWVEETRRVNGVYITVFSDDAALRADIFRSAQPIVGTDRHGCPTDHPVLANPDGYRPDAAQGGLPPVNTVESVSVCRYALATYPAMDSAAAFRLLSSSRVAGEEAKKVVGAIQSAPEGDGPNVENAGTASDAREIIVLRIDTVGGTREVIVRYSGQTGNGFDDGTTKRALTADALRRILAGPNFPGTFVPPVGELIN